MVDDEVRVLLYYGLVLAIIIHYSVVSHATGLGENWLKEYSSEAVF